MLLFSTQFLKVLSVSPWRHPWISFKAPRGVSRSSEFTLRLAWRSRCLRAILGNRETWEQLSTHNYPHMPHTLERCGINLIFFQTPSPHPQLPLKARDKSDIGA